MPVEWKAREYQRIAVDFLLSMDRCALFADMGLGKSVSVLTSLDALHLAGEDQPTLVLGPLRVARDVWSAEAAKWQHLRHIDVSPIIGTPAQRFAAMKRDASVYTCNYENIPWLIETLGGKWPFATVVADESTKVKNMRGNFRTSSTGKVFFQRSGGTMRAAELARMAWRSNASRWWNLTGTPSPNGLIDLWGQTWFLDQGARLGRTFDGFKQRWFQRDWNGRGVSPLPYAQEQITEKLSDICLSIKAKDWFDIADPIVVNLYVDLPAKAMRQYKDMESKMFVEIDQSPVEAFNAASKTIKCLQLANGAAYIDDQGTWKETHTAKLEALGDVIEEAAGMPVMVAYHFKSDLARLQRAFPQGRTLKTSQDEADWNAGRIPVLFAHPASMGHGLNLQDGGNRLAFFGHWWNLEEYQQIIERIGPVRQMQSGHDRPVYIYHIIARGTVDELVMARRETKREVQDLLMDYMKHRRVAA